MPPKIEVEKEGKPKSKSSIILMMILALAAFALLGYLLVWPEYGRLTDAKNKLAEQEYLLENQTKLLGDIKDLIRNYESISPAEKTRLDSFLPHEADEPGIFTLFEFLGAKNNMALLAIDISEKEPTAELKGFGIKEIDIAANFTGGSYSDLKNLFADLENNLRIMDVISVNYTPDPSSLALNIKTYRLEIAPAKAK